MSNSSSDEASNMSVGNSSVSVLCFAESKPATTLRWGSYVVQDFGGEVCSEGCHVMTIEGCNVAAAAYAQACGTEGISPFSCLQGEQSPEQGCVEAKQRQLGTTGCHVQSGKHISMEHNPSETSGGGCLPGHAPLCRLDVEPSEHCQIQQAQGVACLSNIHLYASALVVLCLLMCCFCHLRRSRANDSTT